MEAQPLITVIVPVYNVEKYLRRCLDSIIGQTYQNLEILCIDDGSIDNSGEICEQYAARDARIKVIHQENQGLSTARNRGLDTATGEYIAFVDSDDYIAADVLEQLYQSAVSSDATCVICGYNCVDSNGSILSTYSVHSVQQYSGVESLRRHYYHASGEENFVTVWGKLFCKKLFSDLRFRTGICFEDIHLMPYWLLQSEKVVLIPYAGYNYTQNENSIMHKTDEAHSTRLYKNAFVIWQEHLELYKQRGLEDFENAVYCSIVNKVIAHSLAESIPNEMVRESLVLAHRYTKKLVWHTALPVKQKLYFALFSILGPKYFRSFMHMRSAHRSESD